MRQIAAFSLALLLLTGCGAGPAEEKPAGTDSIGTEPAAAPAVATEAEVRALYASYEDRYREILEITPWEGDFLVRFGEDSYPARFDWVYGATGVRRPLAFDYEGVAEYEITGAAAVRFLTDGVSSIDGYRSFPYWASADLSGTYDENGQAQDYSPHQWPPSAGTETYWAPVDEAHSFGMFGRREAVASAQVEISGVALSFAPLADGSDFVAAFCAPPFTDVAYNAAGRRLTITCHDTFLDSGELTPDVAEAGYDAAWLRENTSLYPEDFPAGSLSGSCPLIESAAIAQAGDDAVVTLTLAQGKGDLTYTVEEGYQGPADTGPYFRVKLRADSD